MVAVMVVGKDYGAEGVINLPSRSYSRVSGSRGVRSPGRKSPGKTAGPGADSSFSSSGRISCCAGAGAQGAGWLAEAVCSG